MQMKRRVIMVGATFFLAAATGHLMQGGGALFNPFSGSNEIKTAKADPVVPVQPAGPAMLADMQPTAITTLAGTSDADLPEMEAGPVILAAATDATEQTDATGKAPEAVMAQDCTPKLTLTAAPAAMVNLSYKAPCQPDTRVVINHDGLAVTGLTSAKGELDIAIPAMTETATFSVTLPGAIKTTADVAVTSLAGYDRMAVQWQGNDAFELHAFEFGADYGDPGHVSAASPRTPGFGQQATGGFMTMIGDAGVSLPMLAQIYTFPTGRSLQEGVVRLTIEAQVTEATCGRDMLGETLQTSAAMPVKVVDLTVTMPGCEVTGDYLVLKNLLPDVKIARN